MVIVRESRGSQKSTGDPEETGKEFVHLLEKKNLNFNVIIYLRLTGLHILL